MHLVGIDLGTTNSALAFVDTERARSLEVLDIHQLVAPGEVGRRPTLPSFLYVPGEHDLPPGALTLPWEPAPRFAVGELGRTQGALVPGRLIASAKSWLCHPAVDREAPILPWGAPPEIERRSPIDASAAYLEHLAASFRLATDRPLGECDLVLTVPASFDEVARQLTVEAARRAGLTRFTLLEEPQAAFYAWLADHPDERALLAPGEVVLVCDIGGGTTDFTLIAVEKYDEALGFQRIAVGDHLLLGGDNMDLALARMAEKKLGAEPKLDAARFQALVQACRTAKERLLGGEQESWAIHLGGRGRGLIAGAVSTELLRAEVEATVVDGFFPHVAPDAEPQRSRAVGLREFGLPFAADPSVTTHLAAFLRRYAARPTALLFNGGVLTAPAIRERILDVLGGWLGSRPKALTNAAPDLAVARGAAYYGRVRRGEGIRIAAGSARAYYVEVEARHGAPTALCLTGRGDEEGTENTIAQHPFELLTNQPVRFRLLASPCRHDRAGALVELLPEEVQPLPPIVTVLRHPRTSQSGAISVKLHVRRTELGTLDLQLRAPAAPPVPEHRWKLEFDLRAASPPTIESTGKSPADLDTPPIDDAALADGADVIRALFDKDHPRPIEPAQAMRELAAALDAEKTLWPIGALRHLWEPLKGLRGQRGRSAEHEARWLNLVGYCLRPGYGFPLDDWRVKEAWRVFNAGMVNEKDPRVRLEWWILWRRVSGGLTRTMQEELGKRIFPLLLGDKKRSDRKSPPQQEAVELWRTVASLERVHREEKWRLGEILLPTVERGRGAEAAAWALGRLGARVPLYGPVEQVVARVKAEHWVERLLAIEWVAAPRELPFAVAEIARASGDRGRDLDEALRQRAAAKLRAHGASDKTELVLKPTLRQADEERFAFGDALPAGLRLSSTEGRAAEAT